MDIQDENTSYCNRTIEGVLDPIEAVKLLYTPTEEALNTIVIPCIMAISILVNSAFIYTVYCSPNLHTVTNAYLVNVAVSDILFIGISGTFHYLSVYLLSPLRNDVYYGEIGCVLTLMGTDTAYFTSVLLLTFVTMERYFAICHPFKQRMISGKSRTRNIIIGSWLFGCLLSASFVTSGFQFETSCVIWPEEEKYSDLPRAVTVCFPFFYSMGFDLVSFPIVFIVNVSLYIGIITALRRRAENIISVGGRSNQQQASKESVQVAKMLVTNGIVFLICQTPLRVLTALSITGIADYHTMPFHAELMVTSLVFLFTNCIINPFIYMYISLSASYQRAFLKVFGLI